MRFYEYESRRIVERAGIPVTDYGFCTTADEARAAAERIGGETVIKSQVLTGGRMKAGGVKFATTPDEAAEHAAAILELEIGGHMPVGVLVDPKADVAQEYYAAVLWDGRAKRPMMLFSDMGGIDIEQVAEEHPDHVGRGHLSNLHPVFDFQAKETVARCGMTGSELNRATMILARLAQLQRDFDMTLAEINPVARLNDGSFVALDAHMEMEEEAVGRHKKMLEEIGVDLSEPREMYEPSDFERNVKAIDAADHRGVIQGKDHGFEGQPRARDRRRRRLADAHRRRPLAGRQAGQLRRDRRQPVRRQGQGPGQGSAAEGRRREDRGDDVDRLQHPR